MHPGLKANLPFRRLDPPRSPTLHHLSTQKPHFLHQPLLRRVRLHEVSLRIPHRPDDRRHSVAKLRTALKKRQKRFVTQFRRRHSRASLFRRILTIARTTLNRTLGNRIRQSVACVCCVSVITTLSDRVARPDLRCASGPRRTGARGRSQRRILGPLHCDSSGAIAGEAARNRLFADVARPGRRTLDVARPDGERLVFDNALLKQTSPPAPGTIARFIHQDARKRMRTHPVATQKRGEPQDHRHRLRTTRAYDYRDAATLVADFWSAVDGVLRERGVIR